MKSKISTYKRSLSLAIIAACLVGTTPSKAQNIIPIPVQIEQQTGNFTITRGTVINPNEFTDLSAYLNEHIERVAGFKLATGSSSINYISMQQSNSLPNEGYTLEVKPSGIIINGGSRGALFYALQTLFQLLPPSVYGDGKISAQPLTLTCTNISDAPRYEYRGVMLDVSRTFFDKQTVMNYIDWAARHKINRFHWHLTDDNGWRIEIKKYPELTNKGAWRGPSEALQASYGSGKKRYGGYYTQQDIREVVKYAAFRNVEIIPEIELPGHSQAVRVSYPETFCLTNIATPSINEEMCNVWCAGREENFDMIKDILSEVAELFPSKYIHIGGDEVNFDYWESCPRCRALMKEQKMKTTNELLNYFVRRTEAIVHSLNKEIGAWNEVLKGGKLLPNTMIYAWQDIAACERAVRAGQPTVAMPGSYMYIDMKQHPLDRGHTWANLVDTRRLYSFDPNMMNVTPEESKLVRGVEAGLFAELLDRPERFMEYQSYPRLCALAEMGWSPAEKRNWDDFHKRLTDSHYDRLSAMGIQFRMDPPEVAYSNGRIAASATTPKAQIRYTTDMSDPTSGSTLYTHPIDDKDAERYRFRAFYNSGFSTSLPPMGTTFDTIRSTEKKTIKIPLKNHINSEGIWLLSIVPHEEKMTINTLEINGQDTSYMIIRNGQRVSPFSTIRLYMDSKNIGADMNLTLTNASPLASPVQISLRKSTLIEPKVKVTTSLRVSQRFPITNLTDYNATSYLRTSAPCKNGDHVTFMFTEPLDCSSIEVLTGIPNVTRYYVTDGDVEISENGTAFRHIATLDDNGSAMIYPKTKIKALRVVVKGSNGEPITAMQDLRITPRY